MLGRVSTAAGWYPDPHDATHDRYWDGTDWTDHRTPRAGQPLVAPAEHRSATTALVLGIASLLFCGLFTGIPAIVLGRRARREIDASNGQLGGRGTATAGFVTGLIGTAWSLCAALLVAGVFLFGAAFVDDCSTVTYSDGGVASTC